MTVERNPPPRNTCTSASRPTRSPLIVTLDGILSCLRSYEAREMLALAGDLGEVGYRWEAGEARHHMAVVTYLIGRPERVPD
ncbi:MAG: hypothetical protein FJX76_10700 [Armatimonadetes bacterium]|nr:hypothetical protein [Armatimonadota bacterium]